MRPALTACIVTPPSPGGNRTTALRWAMRLRELGLRARLAGEWRGEPCDVLIALHARRSHASLARHAAARPDRPRVLALTGTDVYRDIQVYAEARRSLELAARLVVLQPLAMRQLDERLRARARTIYQSAVAPAAPPSHDGFVACVLAHLREVKDPLLAAAAARLLPPGSRVRVVLVGAAPDEDWRARAEAAVGERFAWLGNRPRALALRILAGADLIVVTSVLEGGANVVTEAIACDVPVLSTRIEGSLGILGDDYPGYFAVGDAPGLAALLARCERDADFLATLRARCRALRPLVDPARERASWADLLGELGLAVRGS